MEDIFPPGMDVANVDEYDGSSWWYKMIYLQVRNAGGDGTQTAAQACGGTSLTPENEVSSSYEYDGTNWTTGGSLGTGRYGIEGGTQTSGLALRVVLLCQGPIEVLLNCMMVLHGLQATSLNTARNGDANQGVNNLSNVLVMAELVQILLQVKQNHGMEPLLQITRYG